MTTTIFRIRQDKTGLFSSGGIRPSFSKKGKIWKARGHLSNHFAQFNDRNDVYKDCTVVEYEIREFEGSSIPVAEWDVTPETKHRKELKEIRRKELDRKRLLQRAEILKKELEQIEKRTK